MLIAVPVKPHWLQHALHNVIRLVLGGMNRRRLMEPTNKSQSSTNNHPYSKQHHSMLQTITLFLLVIPLDYYDMANPVIPQCE